jgi:hypothetical protein
VKPSASGCKRDFIFEGKPARSFSNREIRARFERPSRMKHLYTNPQESEEVG